MLFPGASFHFGADCTSLSETSRALAVPVKAGCRRRERESVIARAPGSSSGGWQAGAIPPYHQSQDLQLTINLKTSKGSDQRSHLNYSGTMLGDDARAIPSHPVRRQRLSAEIGPGDRPNLRRT